MFQEKNSGLLNFALFITPSFHVASEDHFCVVFEAWKLLFNCIERVTNSLHNKCIQQKHVVVFEKAVRVRMYFPSSIILNGFVSYNKFSLNCAFCYSACSCMSKSHFDLLFSSFFFVFLHILDQNVVLIVLMIILQMSTAVTVSVRMEEPVRLVYACFIWHVCLDILGWISCTASSTTNTQNGAHLLFWFT